MLQLIITVVSLAILSLAWLPHVTPRLPEEQTGRDSAVLLEKALPQFQRAYQALTAEAEGTPPEATGGAVDASAVFGPLLRIAPAAPAGFQWVYAQHPADSSARAGQFYVCAFSMTAGRGAWDALRQTAGTAGPDAVLGYECGEAVADPIQEFPATAALTLYLTYEPPEEDAGEPPSEGTPAEAPAPESPGEPSGEPS